MSKTALKINESNHIKLTTVRERKLTSLFSMMVRPLPHRENEELKIHKPIALI